MVQSVNSGRLIKAPENFLSQDGIRTVFAEGKKGRRDFIRNAFAAAAAGAAVPAALAQTNPLPVEGGDPNILTLPAHSVGLGQGVAQNDGYGKPSQYESGVQRRQSPGLTQTTQASVSFAPLQSLFGIVTPSGLHFERHHQGWWDIDPSKHRLMINGMVKTPKVLTLDEIKATGFPLILPLNFPEPFDVRDPYEALNVSLRELKHWELAPANPARLEAAMRLLSK